MTKKQYRKLRRIRDRLVELNKEISDDYINLYCITKGNVKMFNKIQKIIGIIEEEILI